jgi:hypothetical protein
MTTTYWVPTIGNALPPLPASQGGTGSANGGPSWIPPDDGWLGGNGDPATISGGGLLIAGTLYLQRIELRAATTITNLWFSILAAGVGASTGSFVGLWNSSGTLLTGSADVGAAFVSGTLGWQSFPLSTPQAFTAGGFIWAGVLCNLATTQVQLSRLANSSNEAIGGPASGPSTLRWAQRAAFGTALASFSPASNAATAFTFNVEWN